MTSGLKKVVYGFGIFGDLDRKEFSFNKKLTWDELTELLERNPRVSMMCDWIAGEVLKNGWKWLQEEKIDGLSKDEYLEQIKGVAEILRGIMFARLHGTSLVRVYAEKDKLKVLKTFHRSSGAHSGWKILKEDVGENGKPFRFTLYIYPPIDDPVTTPITKPIVSKIPVDEVVVFRNPMKGESWGGTPSSKLIAHTAYLEELTLRLLAKHALDLVDNFYLFNNVGSEEEAAQIHEQMQNAPLHELYGMALELEPQSLNISGKAAEFAEMFQILKNFMANGMRVSSQSMDGAPEGTISSAEYNTMLSYAIIEQLQNHWKPYLEEVFEKLGFQNPNIEWNEPMVKLGETPKGKENGKETEE